ncbi:ketoacyl-ACP synthase III [Paenibacillus sp. P2(2022)]|uniref:3-oxoacyl-ACP synthase III family protein n=1 Tax=Paenibacillus TaxID=44249 RepID=UPI0005EC4BEA|nr:MULTISPECIES: ketoacyl-ACP synthase III [Paenibacillus]AUS29376.1 beta-ketoacyl-acyl-carrier-protein synthase III [Paenibacillus polymyxa]KJK30374.1 3-oxoacyl-ACP synthase [Paenibacillus polymyxa]MDG0054902.1 ketoacyl-ACP synthase III [Paenibacillus sp. P2(2022)]
MNIGIKAIEYYLPQKILSNSDLAEAFPGWTEEKIFNKTGIVNRHIANDDEYVSDLAYCAAKKLFENHSIEPKDIDFIILFTQSPDYNVPTTACILQDRLEIPKSAGAFDINLGCSAFIYGLAVAKSLINTNIAKNILLITSETYSKYIDPKEKSVVTIFGDGAAAALISCNGASQIKEFDLGTDGSGAEQLIVPSSGIRSRGAEKITQDDNLYMNGPEIFNFTIDVVPKSIDNVLKKNNLNYNDIDFFVFHQANGYMLNHLRKKCNIPEEKFFINMIDTGNTVSSTIPIALCLAEKEGRIKRGDTILLVGFGVGLSWGSTIIVW